MCGFPSHCLVAAQHSGHSVRVALGLVNLRHRLTSLGSSNSVGVRQPPAGNDLHQKRPRHSSIFGQAHLRCLCCSVQLIRALIPRLRLPATLQLSFSCSLRLQLCTSHAATGCCLNLDGSCLCCSCLSSSSSFSRCLGSSFRLGSLLLCCCLCRCLLLRLVWFPGGVPLEVQEKLTMLLRLLWI